MIRGWESTHVWRNDDNPVLTLAISINSSNAMQGDFMMFNEPGGVFFPVTYEQAEKIRFHEVNETIFAKASYSLIPEAGVFIDL
nr:hypothetical protein [Escherichia coli]